MRLISIIGLSILLCFLVFKAATCDKSYPNIFKNDVATFAENKAPQTTFMIEETEETIIEEVEE